MNKPLLIEKVKIGEDGHLHSFSSHGLLICKEGVEILFPNQILLTFEERDSGAYLSLFKEKPEEIEDIHVAKILIKRKEKWFYHLYKFNPLKEKFEFITDSFFNYPNDILEKFFMKNKNLLFGNKPFIS